MYRYKLNCIHLTVLPLTTGTNFTHMSLDCSEFSLCAWHSIVPVLMNQRAALEFVTRKHACDRRWLAGGKFMGSNVLACTCSTVQRLLTVSCQQLNGTFKPWIVQNSCLLAKHLNVSRTVKRWGNWTQDLDGYILIWGSLSFQHGNVCPLTIGENVSGDVCFYFTALCRLPFGSNFTRRIFISLPDLRRTMRWKPVRFWFHHQDTQFYRDGLGWNSSKRLGEVCRPHSSLCG